MSLKTNVLLVLSSLGNGAIGFIAFWFMVFATSANTSDATMRVGFYVVNGIVLASIIGVIAPWLLAAKGRRRAAAFFVLLPILGVILASVAFLLLDSWIQRTF